MDYSERAWICVDDDTSYLSQDKLEADACGIVRDIAPAFVDCTVIRFCYLDQLEHFPFKFVVLTRAMRRTGYVFVRPEDVDALETLLDWTVPWTDARMPNVPWIRCKHTNEMIMVNWVRKL